MVMVVEIAVVMRHINSGADDQFTDEISGFHGAKMSMLIY
jgi:hypothetical protein